MMYQGRVRGVVVTDHECFYNLNKMASSCKACASVHLLSIFSSSRKC